MIYLSHAKDTNSGRACDTDAPLPAMRIHLVAENGTRTAHVPEVQIALLEQGAGQDDQPGATGGEAW